MVRRVKVTRDGFTRCPACSSHIKVAVVLADTACPFCETALTASTSSAQNSLRQVLSRSLVIGRSGLIAASLLGLAATGVACESGGGSTDVIADVAPDLPPLPEYGAPPEDVGPAPAYGIPADIVEDTAPDLGPQPEYGAPPEDAGPQPAYGVPADTTDP